VMLGQAGLAECDQQGEKSLEITKHRPVRHRQFSLVEPRGTLLTTQPHNTGLDLAQDGGNNVMGLDTHLWNILSGHVIVIFLQPFTVQQWTMVTAFQPIFSNRPVIPAKHLKAMVGF